MLMCRCLSIGDNVSSWLVALMASLWCHWYISLYCLPCSLYYSMAEMTIEPPWLVMASLNHGLAFYILPGSWAVTTALDIRLPNLQPYRLPYFQPSSPPDRQTSRPGEIRMGQSHWSPELISIDPGSPKGQCLSSTSCFYKGLQRTSCSLQDFTISNIFFTNTKKSMCRLFLQTFITVSMQYPCTLRVTCSY